MGENKRVFFVCVVFFFFLVRLDEKEEKQGGGGRAVEGVNSVAEINRTTVY